MFFFEYRRNILQMKTWFKVLKYSHSHSNTHTVKLPNKWKKKQMSSLQYFMTRRKGISWKTLFIHFEWFFQDFFYFSSILFFEYLFFQFKQLNEKRRQSGRIPVKACHKIFVFLSSLFCSFYSTETCTHDAVKLYRKCNKKTSARWKELFFFLYYSF